MSEENFVLDCFHLIHCVELPCFNKLMEHKDDKKDSYKTCDIEFLRSELKKYHVRYLESNHPSDLINIINLSIMLYYRDIMEKGEI